MKEPDFSRHTVADIRDWKTSGKLEVQPNFQRGSVWNPAARIMLIDSILKKIPIPKIFVGTKIKNGSTHRIVIDGQQRITAILDFLGNKFCLSAPYDGSHKDKFFKDLDGPTQNAILSYNLDFNSFSDYTDVEIRDIYHRVNKYTFALNKQELRRADFPGDFLNLAEELATLEYFEKAKIFTLANRRRLGDVEYISELLSILVAGIQDKKTNLDDYYLEFVCWPKNEMEKCKARFMKIIQLLELIFDENEFSIQNLRFRQKSDFYSLFSALDELDQNGACLDQSKLVFLRSDLLMLDRCIEPSGPGLLGEYAVRCVSDANSVSSRKWRAQFLTRFLIGAFEPSDKLSNSRLQFLRSFIGVYDSDMCPEAVDECPICQLEVGEFHADTVWCFPKSAPFLDQARMGHKSCLFDHEREFVFPHED